MEIERLDKAIADLEQTILEFPIGAHVKDDFLPIEEKIFALRKSLPAINARRLTLQAIIDLNISSEKPQNNLNKSYEKLTENTSTYLINKKALTLCHQSKVIQEIIYKNKGSKEIQEKVKICLKKLFLLNDKMLSKQEKKKELLKKQYHLRFKSYQAIHEYQDFLKEKEARIKEQLREDDPSTMKLQEKINRSIHKICIMKKLITNLIASMCHELYKNEELVEMLAKHKQMMTYERIQELAQNEE